MNGIQWVQSVYMYMCYPGARFVKDFLVEVSFDDMLITTDKTELVLKGKF